MPCDTCPARRLVCDVDAVEVDRTNQTSACVLGRLEICVKKTMRNRARK